MSSAPATVSAPPRRMAIWLLFGVLACAALAAGIYFGGSASSSAPASTEAIFALTLPDADGQPQPMAQWRGKVVVVNFWATWCAPCREEMPEFMRVQSELGPRGVQFVGIAADDPGKVKAYAAELGLNYPALIGGFGSIELSKVYGNRLQALPFTLIIDRSGRIVHTQLGPVPPVKLRTILGEVL